MDGLAQGLSISMLSIDDCAEDSLSALTRTSRVFDLIIVEQADERVEGRSRTIAASVFKTGRPVLIVPCVQVAPAALRTVLIAWDGSAPAARALGDALPILARAEHVSIVQVDGRSSAQSDGLALKQHLARHGMDADIKRASRSGSIGRTLLSYAGDVHADLLIMGAYGHSRLREQIFGGTTNTVMERMTIPVLMSP